MFVLDNDGSLLYLCGQVEVFVRKMYLSALLI